MAKVNFDTLQAERNLRAAGISEEQAKMIVEEIKAAQANLPDKSDFDILVATLDKNMAMMDARWANMDARRSRQQLTWGISLLTTQIVIAGAMFGYITYLLAGS